MLEYKSGHSSREFTSVICMGATRIGGVLTKRLSLRDVLAPFKWRWLALHLLSGRYLLSFDCGHNCCSGAKYLWKLHPKYITPLDPKRNAARLQKCFIAKTFLVGLAWPTMSRVKSRQHSLQGQKSFTALSPFLLHRGALQGVASFTLICPGLQSDNLNQGPALNWTNASQAAWRDAVCPLMLLSLGQLSSSSN